MTEIKFEFDLKEKIRVKLLGFQAYINAYWVQIDGSIQYQIEWLDTKNVVNTRHYGEDELERIE